MEKTQGDFIKAFLNAGTEKGLGDLSMMVGVVGEVREQAIAQERARLREEVVKMPAFELDGDGGTLLRLADVLALLRD